MTKNVYHGYRICDFCIIEVLFISWSNIYHKCVSIVIKDIFFRYLKNCIHIISRNFFLQHFQVFQWCSLYEPEICNHDPVSEIAVYVLGGGGV